METLLLKSILASHTLDMTSPTHPVTPKHFGNAPLHSNCALREKWVETLYFHQRTNNACLPILHGDLQHTCHSLQKETWTAQQLAGTSFRTLRSFPERNGEHTRSCSLVRFQSLVEALLVTMECGYPQVHRRHQNTKKLQTNDIQSLGRLISD